MTVMRHLQSLPNVEIEDPQGLNWSIDALADGFDLAGHRAAMEATGEGTGLAKPTMSARFRVLILVPLKALQEHHDASCFG